MYVRLLSGTPGVLLLRGCLCHPLINIFYHNSPDVSSENFVLDQVILFEFIFFNSHHLKFRLISYRYCKEKFSHGHLKTKTPSVHQNWFTRNMLNGFLASPSRLSCCHRRCRPSWKFTGHSNDLYGEKISCDAVGSTCQLSRIRYSIFDPCLTMVVWRNDV